MPTDFRTGEVIKDMNCLTGNTRKRYTSERVVAGGYNHVAVIDPLDANKVYPLCGEEVCYCALGEGVHCRFCGYYGCEEGGPGSVSLSSRLRL
jgi:hypothetical protein